jgi:putative SOS response-associated peptidase YedK
MWWNKPLKEMKLASSNARAETVTTKPLFREAFSRCLIPASGYYEWAGHTWREAAVLFHAARRCGSDDCRFVGPVARPKH